VIEKSDVVIIVADARNPLLHISEPLAQEVQARGKRLVLLLNKVDLMPQDKLDEWLEYLSSRFPGDNTVVVPFSAKPNRVQGRKLNKCKEEVRCVPIPLCMVLVVQGRRVLYCC
jgi:nuclear GTP-binding protein